MGIGSCDVLKSLPIPKRKLDIDMHAYLYPFTPNLGPGQRARMMHGRPVTRGILRAIHNELRVNRSVYTTPANVHCLVKSIDSPVKVGVD